jgi:hypothetical protein
MLGTFALSFYHGPIDPLWLGGVVFAMCVCFGRAIAHYLKH